jgi:hypothetical protein
MTLRSSGYDPSAERADGHLSALCHNLRLLIEHLQHIAHNGSASAHVGSADGEPGSGSHSQAQQCSQAYGRTACRHPGSGKGIGSLSFACLMSLEAIQQAHACDQQLTLDKCMPAGTSDTLGAVPRAAHG